MALRFGTNGKDNMAFWNASEGVVVFARDGDDLIAGTAYADSLFGENDNDVLFGEGGDDVLDGGNGADLLIGGGGADWLFGRAGEDALYGDSGDDELWGASEKDHLEGGAGDDYLNGGDGDDEIFGDVEPSDRYPMGPPGPYRGTDDDELVGGFGNDHLHGGPGSDVLFGGPGYDTLTGGTGADVFKFSLYDVVTRTITIGTPPLTRTIVYETLETDTITDFEVAGGDRLDLDSLLHKTGFSGANASPADAIAQGYVYWVEQGQPGQAGFGTTVYLDRDGGAHNPTGLLGFGDLAVAHLEGVTAAQINASHFLV
jgi:Ca2+-binding RTX toxin-like protein